MANWGKGLALGFAGVAGAIWLTTNEPANEPNNPAERQAQTLRWPAESAAPAHPVTPLTQEQRKSVMSPEVCSALNEHMIGKIIDAVDHLNKYTTGDYKLERNGNEITPVIPQDPPEILKPHVTAKIRTDLGAFAIEAANLQEYTGCDMGPAFSAIRSYALIVQDYARQAPEIEPFLRDPGQPPVRRFDI